MTMDLSVAASATSLI